MHKFLHGCLYALLFFGCVPTMSAPLLRLITPGSAEWNDSIEKWRFQSAAKEKSFPTGVIRLDESLLDAEIVAIELPNGTTIQLKKIQFEKYANHTSWSGASPDKTYVAILIIEGSRLSGHITTPLKRYKLTSTNITGTATIQEAPTLTEPLRGYDAPPPPTPSPELLQRENAARQRSHSASDNEGGRPKSQQRSAATCTSIDVMVVSTPGSRVGSGGEAGLNTTIFDQIAQTNLAFAELDVTFRLVEIYPLIQSIEVADISETLRKLEGIEHLRNRRDEVGADIVIALVDHNLKDCGIARLGPSSIYAFGVVTITPQCLSFRTFTHEVGHLFGADHQKEFSTTSIPFAHGWPSVGQAELPAYTNPGEKMRFICTTDVMGYPLPQQRENCYPALVEPLPYFSSPNRSPTNIGIRYVLGSVTQDNERQIRNTAATVASFRGAGRTPGNQTIPKSAKLRIITDILLNTVE